MSKKTRINNIINYVLKEQVQATEYQSMDDFAPQQPEFNSLDQIVDRYLVRYERESIPTSETYEDNTVGESIKLDLASLQEQAQDEEEDPEGEDEDIDLEDDTEDTGGVEDDALDVDDDGTGEVADAGNGEQTAPVMNTPRINLNDFARSVARMVNNYEALLNPKTTILLRVKAYIKNNYDEQTANELMQTLETHYSLAPDTKQPEENPTPYAVGALSTE